MWMKEVKMELVGQDGLGVEKYEKDVKVVLETIVKNESENMSFDVEMVKGESGTIETLQFSIGEKLQVSFTFSENLFESMTVDEGYRLNIFQKEERAVALEKLQKLLASYRTWINIGNEILNYERKDE